MLISGSSSSIRQSWLQKSNIWSSTWWDSFEDGVLIGVKSIVCPNVACKSHVILTVGSVATTDIEKYSIYQGNPAKENVED